MRKILAFALVLAGAFLFVPMAHAQFTSVTATVTDPNGIPYGAGTMSAVLVPASPGGWTLSGNPYSGRIGPATLDATGTFTANFGSNAIILPAGSQWLITIDSNQGGVPPPLGTGSQTFVVTMTISGASQNISTTLNAAAPKLANLTSSSATIGGSIAATQIAFGSGVNTITGTNNFEYVPASGGIVITTSSVGPTNVVGSAIAITNSGGGTTAYIEKRMDGTLNIVNDSNFIPSHGQLYWDASSNMTLLGGSNSPTVTFYTGASVAPYGAGSAVMSLYNTGVGNHYYAVIAAPGTGDVGCVAEDPFHSVILFCGDTSGTAMLGTALVAGTPNRINLPIATGAAGTFLQTDGGNPQQTSWVTATGWSAVSCATVDAMVYWLTSTTGACDLGITTNTTGTLSVTGGITTGGSPPLAIMSSGGTAVAGGWAGASGTNPFIPTAGQSGIRAITGGFQCSLDAGADLPCLPVLPTTTVSGDFPSWSTSNVRVLADSGVNQANVTQNTSNFTVDGVAYGTANHTLASTAAGVSGQVLTSNGAGVAPTYQTPLGVAPVTSTTSQTSSNPTINTDQKLIELSLTAGYLNVIGQPYLFQGSGTYNTTAASVPALTFKIKLCTVSGCGSGTVVTLANIVTVAVNTAAQTGLSWSLQETGVTNVTGATGNIVIKGNGLTIDLGATLAAADSVFTDLNTATSSNIDLTAALFVDFTVAQSVVGATNAYTQLVAMVAPTSGASSAGIGSITAAATHWFGYTVFSPPPLGTSGGTGVLVANNPALFLFILPIVSKVTSATIFIATGTAATTGDVGMYNASGALVWHTGSIATTSTNNPLTTAVSGGAVTMQPGIYYEAFCDSSASPTFMPITSSGSNMRSFLGGGGGGAPPAHTYGTDTNAGDNCTAGVLPASITIANIVNSGSIDVPAVMLTN